ncbi:MAG: Biotin--[acetyl-CoA-carboxylase] ligase [Bacteroidota bacterium]|jgi:BirA family biotin operon repressor/biotin-[acetyl-CoA-carboxylase] ligase
MNLCESTNAYGFQKAITSDINEGFAWIAAHQTAGKGQRGNQWHAEPNQNLLVSYLLKPDHDLLVSQFYLSKAIANGIVIGLQRWATSTMGEQLPLEIKWPNDIYLDGKKLGGILIESNFQAGKWAFSIVGIGLNINQLNFEGLRATSLRQWTKNPQAIDISEIYNYISSGIENQYIEFTNKAFLMIDETYHSQLFRRGEWHPFEDKNGQFNGKIVQVNEQGLIEIEQNHGTEIYDIKELSFIFKD